METITRLAWLGLALIHLTPALALFQPAMIGRLYGVDASGLLGLLLTHRSALFAAIFVVTVFAAIDPSARRAAALVAGISMIAFLVLYAKAGMPPGPLRPIAIADLIGIPLLLWVTFDAFRA